MHSDGKGFDFHFETPSFRSAVSIRFDFVLFAPPITFEMSFRPQQTGRNRFALHQDRHGVDVIFGAPLIEARQLASNTLVPIEGVLSVRFIQLLKALPVDGTFEILPKGYHPER